MNANAAVVGSDHSGPLANPGRTQQEAATPQIAPNFSSIDDSTSMGAPQQQSAIAQHPEVTYRGQVDQSYEAYDSVVDADPFVFNGAIHFAGPYNYDGAQNRP